MRRCIQICLFLICATSTILQAQSLSSNDRVESILSKMSPEEKIDYIGGTGFAIRAMPGQQLPAFEMSDGPLGVRSNSRCPSTVYAAGIGLTASWNRGLVERVGKGTGRDARARGIHFMLGPGVNIYRSPRNGRNFEYFGEDPFLASTVAVGYITGMQSQGVSATIKHFPGNNSEFLTKFSFSHLTINNGTMDGKFVVSFDISNPDSRSGDEVAQVYVADSGSSVSRPPRNSKGSSRSISSQAKCNA